MPNHVTTRCIVTGPAEQIIRFREQMIHLEPQTNYKGELMDPVIIFDFNRIIPMPQVVKNAESSTTAEFGAELLLLRSERQYAFSRRQTTIPPTWMDSILKETGAAADDRLDVVAAAYLKLHPDWEEAGRKRLTAIAETGYGSWYDWAVAHWDTKWGAYSFAEVSSDPDRYEFTFDTAWRFSFPVFTALASSFPTLAFDCTCFDEGHNFAGMGYFNPPDGEMQFSYCDATDEIYEIVYAQPPEKDEEEDAA
jgi:hypothetical protein